MKNEFDVVAVGELLIDMTMNGKSAQGNALYEANPGGAPCNVLAMLKKLGHKVAFIGKVGDDIFGHELKGVLDEVGICPGGLIIDKDARTTLAFVKTFEDGDRDFSFYRNPGADMLLRKEDIDTDLIRKARIFHFGTLSMTHEGVREATMYALTEAKKAGALISFDPNLREPLWNSLDEAKEQVLEGLKHCDILKISDNEIQWLTGKDDYVDGVEWIFERSDVRLMTVSLGKCGSMAFYRKGRDMAYIKSQAAPFLSKDTIETTGAGDTFGGCILHFVLTKGIEALDEKDLQEMLIYANAAASIITTRRGALRVMPAPDEIEAKIKGTTEPSPGTQ
ncbi:MAG: carbohydrate kinase [Lachnospiraceae bacterium]|nr:carbohydrate kinase [Lachnospiraceae bacterium]